jgi:hypothetical protein
VSFEGSVYFVFIRKLRKKIRPSGLLYHRFQTFCFNPSLFLLRRGYHRGCPVYLAVLSSVISWPWPESYRIMMSVRRSWRGCDGCDGWEGWFDVPVILFPPPEAFMPSMASPFSTEGAGAAWEYHVSTLSEMFGCISIFDLSYLAAAVDGRVLANTVDLVAGGGVDDVVRLGSVARHVCGCGCGILWVVELVVELFGCRKRVCVWLRRNGHWRPLGFMYGGAHMMSVVGGVAHGYIIVVH